MTKGDLDARVLIFAPTGRDGPVAASFIATVGLETSICGSFDDLLEKLADGAAVVLLAEEGIFGQDSRPLSIWIANQPAWSDLPFIVLTGRHDQPTIDAWRARLVTDLRNVSLLERPIQTITLTSTVRAAVRARARQYEVRAFMEAQKQAARDLEAQVASRTAELARANAELHDQMAERARMEDALRQAQKIEALGQLTGGVAHDFNNLLMVISGGLDIIERQTDPARRRRLMDGMRQAATRGAGLTRQLLAFSRRSPLEPEAVDLHLQIGGMRDLLDRTLRGDVHVELRFSDDLWCVSVDPAELELVVLNLAVNARDAMPTGGTVTICGENLPGYAEGKLSGDFVRVSVVDQGTGMSDAVKAHVFEPFYTTKEVGRGSGLGLAQVHGFATQSGGAVRIQSEIGRGTSVELLLPRSHERPVRPQHHLPDPHVNAGPPARLGSVLLVEDDDEVAALVSEMLDQLGYEVTRAASAMAALGALSNGRSVDLVFSDIMMPGGMNGVDLAREIRRRRGDLPVLLTSGYAEAAKEQANAEGVRVLPKPYRLDELAAAIATSIQ